MLTDKQCYAIAQGCGSTQDLIRAAFEAGQKATRVSGCITGEEITALRELEQAVRADRFGCVAHVSRVGPNGWKQDQYLSIIEILDRLHKMRT